MREYTRERYQNLKMQVLQAYGLTCACCGLDHPSFLCIDHVEGGGNTQRALLKGGSHAMYRWLIKNNFPEGYQTLCLNCNHGKELGLCPSDRCKTLDRPEK